MNECGISFFVLVPLPHRKNLLDVSKTITDTVFFLSCMIRGHSKAERKREGPEMKHLCGSGVATLCCLSLRRLATHKHAGCRHNFFQSSKNWVHHRRKKPGRFKIRKMISRSDRYLGPLKMHFFQLKGCRAIDIAMKHV